TPSTTRWRRSARRSTNFRRRRSASARRCAAHAPEKWERVFRKDMRKTKNLTPGARPDMGVVGKSVPRLEDPPLVTGRGRFAADVAFPRMLHMRMVRSAHAHGRIVSIDAAAALAMPGVIAV